MQQGRVWHNVQQPLPRIPQDPTKQFKRLISVIIAIERVVRLLHTLHQNNSGLRESTICTMISLNNQHASTRTQQSMHRAFDPSIDHKIKRASQAVARSLSLSLSLVHTYLRSTTRHSCLQISRFFSNGVTTNFSFCSTLRYLHISTTTVVDIQPSNHMRHTRKYDDATQGSSHAQQDPVPHETCSHPIQVVEEGEVIQHWPLVLPTTIIKQYHQTIPSNNTIKQAVRR
jgi:hypothetical protein